MSLLLSILGTTALIGGAVANPVTATMTSLQPENKSTNIIQDIILLNHKIEAEAQAKAGKNEVQQVELDTFKINWFDKISITSKDYFKIDWKNSWFVLNLTLFYKNNIWGNSSNTIKKQEIYKGNNLGMMFIQPTIYYNDGRFEAGFNRYTDHTWEFIFSDNGIDLEFNTKIWSLARDNSAWSYANLTFDSFAYNIQLFE